LLGFLVKNYEARRIKIIAIIKTLKIKVVLIITKRKHSNRGEKSYCR
jgi:hypothetical protein